MARIFARFGIPFLEKKWRGVLLYVLACLLIFAGTKKGFSKMVLNVFKHTTISYSMYQKCGFKVIEDYGDSVIMEKVFNGE